MKKKKLKFGGFPVAGMRKKKYVKKKKNGAGNKLGYYPFVGLSHDTVNCIVTQGIEGAHGQPRYSRIWPQYGQGLGLRHGRPARKGERRAREGLAVRGVCRDTINCIVLGRRPGRWMCRETGHDTAPVRATTRHDTAGLGAVCTQPGPWVCTLCT